MRFFRTIAKVKPKYRQFNRSFGRVPPLKRFILKNKHLQKTVKHVFSKTGLTFVTAASLATYAATQISSFIHNNSGCFLFENDEIVGKMKNLSCCQKESIQHVKDLGLFADTAPSNACDGYDNDDDDEDAEKEKEDTCCRFCDCKYHDCAVNQRMECRRPTVGEALTHFSKDAIGWIGRTLGALMPFLKYILIAVVLIFVFIVIRFLT
ncbi:hypothetical protein RF55_19443 [Lasius niger]|uniref:Uncharacterized protein n=1 Tax=Lasius niger TaxID=67767 RepID=A0A0J7K017_LASNI|nr:hypothetical protein RF55_19443 [Lasius niger]